MKTVTTNVTSCYHSCPFFATSMDGMYCNHPFFEKRGWDAMIITHDNSKDTVPDECPLREAPITTVVKLRLVDK